MPYQVMKKEILFQIVSSLIELIKKHPIKKVRISLYGGEPLANKGAIFAVLNQFGSFYEGVEIDWVMNSNGSLLSEDDISYFKKCNLDFHLSIDGPQDIHNALRPKKAGDQNTFQMAIKAGELLSKHGLRRQINSYVNSKNYNSLFELVDITEKLGIKRVYLDLLYSSETLSSNDVFVRYAQVHRYAMRRGIELSGPWWRAIAASNSGMHRSLSLSRSLTIEFNVDGSFYFSSLVETRKFMWPLSKFEQVTNDLSLSEYTKMVESYYDSQCDRCSIYKHCRGVAINQVDYHLGTGNITKYSCDFYRRWLPYLTGEPTQIKSDCFEFIVYSHLEDTPEFETLNADLHQSLGYLESIFGNKLKSKPLIFVFGDSYHLRAFNDTDLPDWVKIYTHYPNIIMKAGAQKTHQLTHELAHLFLYDLIQNKLPIWQLEGLCEALNYKLNFALIKNKFLELKKRRSPFSLGELTQVKQNLLEIDDSKIPENMAYVQCAYEMMIKIQRETNPSDFFKKLKSVSTSQSLEL